MSLPDFDLFSLSWFALLVFKRSVVGGTRTYDYWRNLGRLTPVHYAISGFGWLSLGLCTRELYALVLCTR